MLDAEVAAVEPSEFAQTFHQSARLLHRQQVIGAAGRRREIADAAHRLRLLGPRFTWREACGAGEDKELAPVHSTTSSERVSSGSGIVNPRLFAIFRLITSSNASARWIGRPAGLDPPRI